MSGYLYLAIPIVAEVIATTALKKTSCRLPPSPPARNGASTPRSPRRNLAVVLKI